MGKLSNETWTVISEFQKYVKGSITEIDKFSLAEIRKADEEMGWRDENQSFRLAMKNRIQDLQRELDKKESRVEQSHIRSWQLVTGILSAILVAIVVGWLV